MKKFFFHPFFVNFTRIFLGLLFFSSGMGKITHGNFPGLMGPVWLEEKLAVYDLGFYARFIAYSQVFIGSMLIFKRFSAIASIMIFPVILNILMVTISMNWRGTPYVVTVFLLMNVYLLITEWPKLKFLFFEQNDPALQAPLKRKNFRSDSIWISGYLLICCSGFFYVIAPLMTYVLCALGFLIILFLSNHKLASADKD